MSDGGPAHPVPVRTDHGVEWLEGLTKRERYALEALKIILPIEFERVRRDRENDPEAEVDVLVVGAQCFAVADGMLRAGTVT